MNRVMRGSVLLAMAIGMGSCSSDPTSSLRGSAVKLIATPAVLFVDQNDSNAVLIEAVDAQGNRLAENLSVGTVGAGISVAENLLYNREFQNDTLLVRPATPTRVQYFVRALLTVSAAFTITDAISGKSITVPVSVVPNQVTTTFSTQAPLFGDTVTLVGQPGVLFDPASTVTFSPGGRAAVVGVAADSTSISFVPNPGSSGKATITNVRLASNLGIGGVTVTTTDTIFITGTLPVMTLSATSGVAGDPITLTASAPFRFTTASVVTVPGAAGLAVTGFAADSSTLTFLIGPGASGVGPVTATTFISGAPALPAQTLNSGAQTLTTPVVTTIPAVFASATPSINDTVTATASGFKFLPSVTISFGGTKAVITSISADSGTLHFIPVPGSVSGTAAFTNVALSFLPSVPLSLQSVASLTVPAGYAGTGAIATAPTITIPGVGSSSTYLDAGAFVASADCGNIGGNCRFYKFVLGGSADITVTLTWSNTADIGGYFVDAGGNDLFGDFACDAHGSGATAQPETCTETFAAGTYWLGLANFSATPPANVRIDISQ